MGTALVHAHNWRRATFASLGLVGLAVVGLIGLGAQPKAVPHIIEVDHLGAATYRGPAGVAGAEYTAPDAVIVYHLRRFVDDTRALSSDAAIVKRNWLDAYALVTPRGANMLSAYVQAPENDPFRRAQEERVSLELLSAVRVSGETWQLDWRETSSDKNGNPSGPASVWRGMFRVIVKAPKTPEEMAKNPIGLFVDEFHWDKVQG